MKPSQALFPKIQDKITQGRGKVRACIQLEQLSLHCRFFVWRGLGQIPSSALRRLFVIANFFPDDVDKQFSYRSIRAHCDPQQENDPPVCHLQNPTANPPVTKDTCPRQERPSIELSCCDEITTNILHWARSCVGNRTGTYPRETLSAFELFALIDKYIMFN